MFAYERALNANPNSIPAMNAISLILRTREEFPKAVEYLQAILKLDQSQGEVWGSLGKSIVRCLSRRRRRRRHRRSSSFFGTNVIVFSSCSGHCYLMMDDLQQAYAAYQSALLNLRNPKVSHNRRLRRLR